MGIETLFLTLNDTHIEKVFFPILTFPGDKQQLLFTIIHSKTLQIY